jgi:hypothetical protein
LTQAIITANISTMKKTLREHLNNLKPEHRDLAFFRMHPFRRNQTANSLSDAILLAFGREHDGAFWSDIHSQLESGTYHFTEAESAGRAAGLPEDSAKRKEYPIYSGLITYFGDALAAVAKLSYEGNKQHHPDKPLHWDDSKSTDSRDALLRHIFDMEKANKNLDFIKELDEATRVAWRGLENLQRLINGTCQYTNNK